jgi:hypothetical protein
LRPHNLLPFTVTTSADAGDATPKSAAAQIVDANRIAKRDILSTSAGPRERVVEAREVPVAQ